MEEGERLEERKMKCVGEFKGDYKPAVVDVLI